MSNLKVQFGNRLRQLRASKGITQEELSNFMEVSVETVSNIERGIYGARFDKLEKIAECLNVPVFELFKFEN